MPIASNTIDAGIGPPAFKEKSGKSQDLLARLKAYAFPPGEEAVRGIREIKATQRGEVRMGPDARWNSFAAEEFVDATNSAFRWRLLGFA